MTLAVSAFLFLFIFLTLSGATRFSGRSMTLLDPTYAKKYVPIIASVSEHQPTSWSSYFFDLGPLILFMPIGFYYCLVHKCTLGKLFIGMYGVLATYFSCVMIRLMLVLAPAACIIAAIAVSEIMRKASKSIRIYLTQGFEESETSIFGLEQNSKFKVKKEEKQPEAKKDKKSTKTAKVGGISDSFTPLEKKKKSRLSFDSSVMILVFIIFTL
jgi:dolichyl-diphosphooligosaccharide--protein glycosyltransferase